MICPEDAITCEPKPHRQARNESRVVWGQLQPPLAHQLWRDSFAPRYQVMGLHVRLASGAQSTTWLGPPSFETGVSKSNAVKPGTGSRVSSGQPGCRC